MPLVPVAVPDPLPERIVPLAPITVPAGFPSPAADDLADEVDPIAWITRNPTTTFWWRVKGDSLSDIGIRDGDLIAVDRDGRRRLGRVVVAVVDGEVTVKVLTRRGRGDGAEYWLEPANRAAGYPAIRMTEGSEVWGVVAGVVRRCDIE